MSLIINDFFNFLPEFFYIFLLCLLPILAIINKRKLLPNELTINITDLSIISLVFLAILYFTKFFNKTIVSNFLLIETTFTLSLKLIVIVIAIIIFIISKHYYKTRNVLMFEVPIVILFSTLGILTVISSNDLMLTYLALEMQGLSIYTLVSSKTHSNVSTEAGIKYFILGSFISGFILYGISLIYLVTGTTNLTTLVLLLSNSDIPHRNLVTVAIILITLALLFKLSAAPLHNWTPDVFDGAPTLITLFISTLPKIAILFLVVNIIQLAFSKFAYVWYSLFLISALLSLIIGCLGGLYQTKIKRLLAYSTINNIGFILLSIVMCTQEAITVSFFYLLIYISLNIGIFTSLILLVKNKYNKEITYINELEGIFFINPVIAFVLAFNIFSFAGIPPFAGFLSKFFVLFTIINNNMIFIALFAVVMSVITSVYYIRLIRIIFFNREKWNNTFYNFKESLSLILYVITAINVYILLNVEFVLKTIEVLFSQ